MMLLRDIASYLFANSHFHATKYHHKLMELCGLNRLSDYVAIGIARYLGRGLCEEKL